MLKERKREKEKIGARFAKNKEQQQNTETSFAILFNSPSWLFKLVVPFYFYNITNMSNYYFAIVGATDNPIYETEIVPSSRSSAFIDSNRVCLARWCIFR